ncbi:conserved hypothetical protein [Verticillium alfalfae VaMs.102]|uniref:Uncharacterized protein n=1 Tax=Verticillium alfalfae (strain VaMs.102 / ATCC MYA-4576 / FGSC 10136) TaxID=526221 RepID=C9SBE4_VERA1|nr:conserved hypothetical protein [Verticillium alfalfae VaMs.102]EEY15678.1 conserved hypothetical protein [Verticillium alfalfae VaMs.102]
MSHKQSKISGFFKTTPRLASGRTDRGGSQSSHSGQNLEPSVEDVPANEKRKGRKILAKPTSRNPPRHLQARSDNAQRLPTRSRSRSPPPTATSSSSSTTPAAAAAAATELSLPAAPASVPPSSIPTCKAPSEAGLSQTRTPKRMTHDSTSIFSSPLVRRQSTPVVIDPKQSFDLGYAPSSPTRTLFATRISDSATSKRTADYALLSPKKDRLKSARTSPSRDEPSTLSESILSLPDHLSSPLLAPSSPPSSTAMTREAFSRDLEIKGSDDEEDDSSDCSLPDLEMLLSRKSKPDVLPSLVGKAVSPRTKLRRRRPGEKSPAPAPPKPMFDMKTLMEHQRRDDAIAASSSRLDGNGEEKSADLRYEAGNAWPGINYAPPPSPNTARRKFISVAGVNDKEVAGKAMRAMERTEATTSTNSRCYFFKRGKSSSEARPLVPPPPFPQHAALGPWALLAKEGTRKQHLQSNTLQCVASRHRLPDEIFFWMLMAIEGEKRPLQVAYSHLLSANAGQIRELVTPGRLRELFGCMNAADGIDVEKVQLVREDQNAYAGRDWSGLRTYLNWLQRVAGNLRPESVKYAVLTLLRMAADRTLMSVLETRIVHQTALTSLVEAVDGSDWDEFCQHACASIWTAFDTGSLRLASIQQIVPTTRKSRELRRRLALAFFLGDATLARQHPDDQGFIPEAMHRLKGDEFHIKRKTDYVELRAQIQLFDIALDDGSFCAGSTSYDDAVAFDAEVDHLAQQLKTLWGSINDSGAAYLSRTEAKSSIDCAQKRLTYAVRSKPPPKRNIFELPEQRKEVVTETQKAFMSKFIGALKKPPRLDILRDEERRGSMAGSDDASEAEDSFMTAVGELS